MYNDSMYKICKNMLETIMSIEDYYDKIQELQDLYADILSQFEETINCPSNWSDIRERLKEEYKDDNFALDIIGEY